MASASGFSHDASSFAACDTTAKSMRARWSRDAARSGAVRRLLVLRKLVVSFLHRRMDGPRHGRLSRDLGFQSSLFCSVQKALVNGGGKFVDVEVILERVTLLHKALELRGIGVPLERRFGRKG